MPTGEKLSVHRGYEIWQEGPTSFFVWRGYLVARCGSAWSCVCYIDELLSP